MKNTDAACVRGRPRAFDPDRALGQALDVFWHKGYEGASLADLTEAMGINRPSLYAAFGNKDALFRKALARYIDGPVSYIREALEEPTALAVARKLLHATADALSDKRRPGGCLVIHGALACGSESEDIRKELLTVRRAGETQLRRRFERAQAEGDLSRKVNAADLARFLTTVCQGMAIQGAGGASGRDLHRIADQALASWPAS